MQSLHKVNTIRISDLYQFKSNILKKSRPRIIVKLDTGLEDNELKDLIEACINSKIIDAIEIGGMTNQTGNKETKYFTCGASNNEKSLDLLKKSYQYSKGNKL